MEEFLTTSFVFLVVHVLSLSLHMKALNSNCAPNYVAFLVITLSRRAIVGMTA